MHGVQREHTKDWNLDYVPAAQLSLAVGDACYSQPSAKVKRKG